MSLSYFQLSVPVYVRMLGNLSHLLDRAAGYCSELQIDESVLLQSRLFPNMYPLLKQVQIATDQAKGSIGRLSGITPPKFDDTETSIAELRERIGSVLAYLETIPADALDGTAGKTVTMPWMPDHPMQGEFYLLNFALPNVYFHVTTAYNILRHNGVPLGKMDYIGEI
ncbi:DUF1993 domain-containing protein [Jeongeupia naejangsanensis]|uniref:DUF1993 domain-containing protein n=1 Tax=Jeongeupia naejangsanensis TaxID=613195 RepID=A0ABS2BLX7_9NEIS|nr:DUF1993 domain-containing protein [Jeongeupia naejangsanensis]MBM3116440.1 DUF1993 domain-containing protein [Jeongeupia naejangsanensis]